jgi:hypothetical protein
LSDAVVGVKDAVEIEENDFARLSRPSSYGGGALSNAVEEIRPLSLEEGLLSGLKCFNESFLVHGGSNLSIERKSARKI